MIKEFKFIDGDYDPCLKFVQEKNPSIIEVQPKDRMVIIIIIIIIIINNLYAYMISY